jgi:hypothetical protein
VVAEHLISATVALSDYTPKPDFDLLEAVQEANIVVERLNSERGDRNVWVALCRRKLARSLTQLQEFRDKLGDKDIG